MLIIMMETIRCCTLKKVFGLLALLTLTSSWTMLEALPSTQQAKKEISGIVTDALNESIIGANVVEEGTTNGTITDLDGKFTLQVAPDATIVITYIGYIEQKIPVGNQSTFTITLKEDSQNLEEVVVVGYGVQKKVNVTGSVSSVNFEELSQSRPLTNVSTALAGMSAGVQVMQSSGQPGEDGANIRIRGVGTLNNAAPLIIIDGMEGVLDAVSPQDIESVSVLKDAASASIYGSRGANGVILVTTKKGKSGKLNVNYTGRVSIQKPSSVIDFVSDYADYMEIVNEGFTNIGQAGIFSQKTIDTWRDKAKRPSELNENGIPNYVAYPNTDWSDWLFDQGLMNEHNVSVSGGSEKLRVLLSAGYLDNPGLVENTGIKRYSLRANIEADVTPWLTVGTKTWANQEDKEIGDFGNANNYLRQTTPGVYPIWNGKYGAPEAPEESLTANNIFEMLNRRDGRRRKSRFNTTLFSKISPLKGLTWNFNLNYQREIREDASWTNAVERVRFSDGTVVTDATAPSEQSTNFSNYGDYQWTIENLLNYSITINRDHDISALLGHNEYYYHRYTNSADKKGLIDQSLHQPSSATEMVAINGNELDHAMRSFFGRVNYAYKSRYLFEANLRYDGSSRYHKDHRWGVFPSFSGGWRISEEAFMADTRDLLDNLKLRASWGKLGNNGGNNVGNYEYQSTYNVVKTSFGGFQSSGLAVGSIANTVLSWESTAVTDIGLDVNLLGNRLSLEADWYYKYTDGILYRPNIYLTAGNKNAPRMNIAEMANKGIELTVGWNDRFKLGNDEFHYSISGNFGYNKNEVVKYKGKLDEKWVVDENGNRKYVSNLGDVSTGGTTRITEGKMVEEYYLKSPYKGSGEYYNADGTVNINGGPKDGMIRSEKDLEWVEGMINAGYTFMPNKSIGKTGLWYGDYIYADANGDGIYGNSYDNQFLGYNKHPKYNYGFQMSASWKGFDVSMNWAGAAGFKLYWGATTGYNAPSVRNGLALSKKVAYDHYFYDPENPSDPRTNINAKYGRITGAESGYQNHESSTNYLYDGDYLKLKNLTVGYTLPKHISKKIYTESLRVYFSGENLLTLTSFPWMDPEMSADPRYTPARQFAFGLNVSF